MEKLNNILIGITTKCKGKCFACDRKTVGNFVPNVELDISIVDHILNYVNGVSIIGSVGDFVYHSKSFDIAKLIIEKRKSLLIETNGSKNDKNYWAELGKLFSGKDAVIRFSVDDIDNEYDRYRGFKVDNVIDNIRTFIKNGGTAYVKTIIFNMNQNKIKYMSKFFRSIGAKKYLVLYSTMYQKEGPLSPPDNCPVPEGTRKFLYSITKSNKFQIKICPWLKKKMIYMDEYGELHPCCHILPYYGTEYFTDINDLYLNNKDKINLYKSSFEVAYNSEYIQYIMNNPDKVIRCQTFCSIPENLQELIIGLREVCY